MMKIKILLLSLLFIISCSNKTKDDSVLYVGTSAEYPPYEYLDENGNIVGFDIDYINEVAKLINKKIEIKDMTFDGLLPALESKKVDLVIAGMVATPQRRKLVDFSEPYYGGKQAIVVSANDDSITNFNSLVGKNVAVALGYIADSIVSDIEGIKKIDRLNSSYACILAVKNGKSDATVMSYLTATGYAKTNPDIKVVEVDMDTQDLYIAFRKGDNALIEEVNKAINTLKENGTYEMLVNKYFN